MGNPVYDEEVEVDHSCRTSNVMCYMTAEHETFRTLLSEDS